MKKILIDRDMKVTCGIGCRWCHRKFECFSSEPYLVPGLYLEENMDWQKTFNYMFGHGFVWAINAWVIMMVLTIFAFTSILLTFIGRINILYTWAHETNEKINRIFDYEEGAVN